MTLNEFINSCPKGIRLGQWFVINYWKGAATEQSIDLFQLDGDVAYQYIFELLNSWQWDILSLPEFTRNRYDTIN